MSLPWHNLGAKPPWAREKNIGQKVNHEQREGAGPNRDQSGSPVLLRDLNFLTRSKRYGARRSIYSQVPNVMWRVEASWFVISPLLASSLLFDLIISAFGEFRTSYRP